MAAKAYEQGTFCWVELGTPDAQGAKKFYSALLGWTFDDRFSIIVDPQGATVALYQNAH